jgi:UDP-N-acetylmuramyl pentapeptide phosphotransferase/UDP-N-acetylglucosamine-1-phosphate transferase
VTVALALAVGFAGARVVWTLLRPVFRSPLFARTNFRGHELPTAAGVAIALALLLVESLRVVAAAAVDGHPALPSVRAAMLVLALGLSIVGLVDDLVGDADRRGFRGHLAALAHGHLTTGALKLVGGGAVAVLVVAVARPQDNVIELFTDAALIGLCANLGNLLDVAPGRVTKVAGFAFAVLVAVTAADPRLGAAAVVVGGAAALLVDDLRERLMIGDAGANLLGGALGLAVVSVGGSTMRLLALGIVAILNGASEWVSFSRVIEAFAPLRALDRAGRRP